MARTTTNLGLKVWDLPSDGFSPTDLAFNWDAIDADYSRARSANQVEILATVPVTSLFTGRLVYLNAADGGFEAHTLIRYSGSNWKAVGPFESKAALPVANLYAGRLVFLTSADGGFAANSLVYYNGASWSLINGGITVNATVPVTGLYSGRMVVLSAADGGFLAWDVIRYNGSTWSLIGPQPTAAVPAGTEKAYVAVTTDSTTTTTAIASGTTIASFGAITYEATKYYLDISIPRVKHTIADTTVSFGLYEAATPIGGEIKFDTYNAARHINAHVKIPFTPTAASHTYTVQWCGGTAGTGTITATSLAPAIFRIFKA